MIAKKQLSNLDFWLIGAICILCIFGIICIGSATHINLGEDPSNFYKQMVWFAIGIILMLVASVIDYTFFSQFYIFIYIINILMLLAVLLLGENINGATRWISIGPVSLQPSEFAKLIMIFFFGKAAFCQTAKHESHSHTFAGLHYSAYSCGTDTKTALSFCQPGAACHIVHRAVYCRT